MKKRARRDLIKLAGLLRASAALTSNQRGSLQRSDDDRKGLPERTRMPPPTSSHTALSVGFGPARTIPYVGFGQNYRDAKTELFP